jgi:hypothetical protein
MPGKSARASLIHGALHAVSINEMLNTKANTILRVAVPTWSVAPKTKSPSADADGD